jgi:1,4-dihydroxy-2-naphthoate octaprenyltransferase
MHSFKTLLGPMRLPFLILTPACVAVGVGTAYWQTQAISWLQVLFVLLGALASHICINVFNEYFDFKSGLDAKTQPTPFSGGSGTLPAQPGLEKSSLRLAIGAFAMTARLAIIAAGRPRLAAPGNLYDLVGLSAHALFDSTRIGLWYPDGHGHSFLPDRLL